MQKSPAFLLFLALLLAGCGGRPASNPSPAAEAPSGRPGVELSALIDDFPAVLDRLNAPLRVEETPVENRHVPDQVDTLRTYHYEGLSFTVYDVSASGKELLQDVSVTSDAYATPQNIRVGMMRQAVEQALGAPDAQQGGAWIYHLDPEPTPGPTLIVRFRGDTVHALEWSFYVD